MSIKKPYFIKPLLILGLVSSGDDIHIYLHSLIHELNELWTYSVNMYDAHTCTTFCMPSALLWTISDFPAYKMLSSWSTKELMAFLYYHDKVGSKSLCTYGSICYMEHQSFQLV